MRNTRLCHIGLIVSVLTIIGLVGNIIIMSKAAPMTDRNTLELQATAAAEHTFGGTDRQTGTIYTEEYGDKLKLPGGCSGTELPRLSISAGEHVCFRVEDTAPEQLSEGDFVYVVSLRTEQQELYSMEDYNRFMEKERQRASIVSAVVIFLMLVLAVRCVWVIRRRGLSRQSKNDSCEKR